MPCCLTVTSKKIWPGQFSEAARLRRGFLRRLAVRSGRGNGFKILHMCGHGAVVLSSCCFFFVYLALHLFVPMSLSFWCLSFFIGSCSVSLSLCGPRTSPEAKCSLAAGTHSVAEPIIPRHTCMHPSFYFAGFVCLSTCLSIHLLVSLSV